METKTSKEWLESMPKEYKLIIIDPDGWDRTNRINYDYSFNREKITKNEFTKRLVASTIQFNKSFMKSINKFFED